jgi:predicted outer membrane repeat protein
MKANTKGPFKMRNGWRWFGNGEKTLFVCLCWVFMMSLCTPLRAADIYVSPAGGGSGTSADPTDLQTALDTARINGEDDTIYLQVGTYDASRGPFSYGPVSNDNMAVILEGGWNTDFTIQSDDPSLTMLDGGGASRVIEIIADATGVDITFTLEVLTIQNGYANDAHGAGIRAYTGVAGDSGVIDLTLNNCLIRDNNAETGSYSGGGMYTNCYFEVHNSTFSSNHATDGGAIYIQDVPSGDQSLAPIIDSCSFDNNDNVDGWQGSTLFNNVSLEISNCSFTGQSDGSTSGSGSPVFTNTGSFLTVSNSIFSDNTIDYWGSAILFWNAGGVITNSLFIDNKAGGVSGATDGYGAIALYKNEGGPDTINITNCTFVGNRSRYSNSYGGAIHNRTVFGFDSTLTVTNSVFRDNGTFGVYYGSPRYGTFIVSYSDVEGGFSGTYVTDGGHNIDLNPEFVGGGDYRLTGGSPCIDAGNNDVPDLPDTDLDGNPRRIEDPATPNTGNGTPPIVDMGAYEYNPHNYGDEFAVDFDTYGLWHYNGSSWTNLAGWDPQGMLGWDGGLAVVFPGYGLWNYDGTTWTSLAGWEAEDGVEWDSGVAVDFGTYGLWNYDGSDWTSLAGWDPDGNMVKWGTELVVDFGTNGLWNYDGTSWTSLASWDPEDMVEWGSDLVGDFGAYGLWSYDGTSWTSLASWDPEGILVWDGGLAVAFAGYGVWNYDGTTWTSLAGWEAEGGIAWNGGLAVDFGVYGLWNYDGSTWTSLASWDPEDMEAWGTGLAVDFDTYGLWNYDGSSWTSLAGWNPDDMVDVDLY